jgi:thiopurine S-methyltransferase
MTLKLNKQFWNNRYLNNETSWDIGIVSTPLKDYFDQLSDKNIKILIPGCGTSHEAEYLHLNGFKNVFVADYALKALSDFSNRVSDFPRMNLLNTDFFKIEDSFDLIIEQTFFCAIDREKRKEYAKKMSELLNQNGKLVGLLFDDQLYEEHPPYGGNKKEYASYFDPYFKFKVFDLAYNSIKERSGRELFMILERK